MACKRINCTINEKTLEKLDSYANEMNLPRSTTIAVIVNNFLSGREALSQMSNFVDVFNQETKKTKTK